MSSVLATSAQGVRSPAFRVRVLLPASALAAHGVALEPVALFDADEERRFRGGTPLQRTRVLATARRRLRRRLADVSGPVLVQRQVDLLPSLALERRAASGSRLVYDVDDALWHESDPAAGGHALAGLKRSARKATWLAERADQVVAGNAVLAEWLAARTAAPVAVVPSLVDVASTPLRHHADGEELVLGWIGSATTRPHLDRVAAAVAGLAAARPDRRIALEVVGGETLEVPGATVRARAWSEETERSLLRRMDIGLMPLPDTPWTRGKCAYKAQQYMAAGVPVVADDVGVSAQVIGADAAGLLPTGTDAWRDALVALSDDVGLRRRLGAEGRARAERDFDVTARAPELARLVRG